MMDGLKPLAPAKGKLILKPRLCPNCQESNTPESRFCSKCKFVLSFDAYNETITDAERAKEEQQRKLQEMEKKLNFMYEALQATKILKDIDNEQKKLLAESPKMQKIAKEIQEEEEQELREDLEEGLKQEQEGK
jgi:predicted amidophosphoribosyltransferase